MTVVDEEIPVISLNDIEITIGYESTFVVPECIVTDNYDTVSCTVTGDVVDTSIIGNNSILYDAVDSSGNHALQVELIVHVVDEDDPIITINNTTQVIEYGDVFSMPVCSVTDNLDDDLICIISGDTVDTSILGTYEIYFNAVDSSLNTAIQETLIVEIVDTTIPVITLMESMITIPIYESYVQPICSVIDNVDNSLVCVVSGDTVDTSIAGTYTVYFDVVDTEGNSALQQTLTVVVKEGYVYYEGYTFDLVEREIVQYDGFQGHDLVIPSTIAGIPVEKIDDEVFQDHFITSVVIPASITYIDSEAFSDDYFDFEDLTILGDSTRFDDDWREIGFPYQYFNGFAINRTTGFVVDYDISYGVDVVIPSTIDGVTIIGIGDRAFSGMGLETIVIPEGITTIEEDALSSNPFFSLTIPESVTLIEEGAFDIR